MPEPMTQNEACTPAQSVASSPRLGTALRRLSFVGVGLLLALVFALYTQPDMMVTVAEQLWACF